ncbi:unnamed protein product, partial [Iphiclides podalirius]
MAVKKHEVLHETCSKQALHALAQYIDMMNEQPNYMPPIQELVKNCQDIVKCLASTSGQEDQLWDLLTTVEEFLVRIISTVDSALRHEIVTAILDKFYSLISDPESRACPAMSVALIVLDGMDEEASLSAARWLVQRGENGPNGAGLRASLACLYRWIHEWNSTPALGDWLLAYIKALEENEHFDILIEVSVENLCSLVMMLNDPTSVRQPVADTIFHILASLRESSGAFEKVAQHVTCLLVVLATDSGQWSRQLLQNVVDISTAMIRYMMSILNGVALDKFKDKYSFVIGCLERHMSSSSRFLQLPPWKARNVTLPNPNCHVPLRKVGLLNLGNTCYMNSVMQALLATKVFSSHVVLRMTAVPYWAKLGALFAKMMHSISTKLNPEEFFKVVRSPFFTKDNQHDSSEFLGYLFVLLQSYEHRSDRHFDYSRPAVLASRPRQTPNVYYQAGASVSDNERCESSYSFRSTSPRPGTSGVKRTLPEQDVCPPPKKRMRIHESMFLRRDSFIDTVFGGVLLTRVECTVCHSSSLSRDIFRDLQLAFPEKPAGWKHSVQDLLEFYFSKETLTGDNRYACVDCGALRDAERSVTIENPPRYLVLVLKNFKFEPKLQVQTKLMLTMFYNDTVTLPTRSRTDRSAYTVYAAIIHEGTTLDSGHYYTLAKDNNQWFSYNDEVVTPAEPDHLHTLKRSSTPYVLFYRRTDVEEGTVPSLGQLPPKFQEKVIAHNKHYIESVRKMKMSRP